jgi:RNA recognition motif-containing protein
MREYVKNLTNNLIGKHRFDAARRTHSNGFIPFVYVTLMTNDVGEMSHETLGKVMCGIGLEDLSGRSLVDEIHFVDGGCEELLRVLVSWALAHVIQNRLDGNSLYPYFCKRSKGIAFIHFNRILHSREALEEMKMMGYRAAYRDEVDRGEKRKWPVVALGFPQGSTLVQEYVLYLDGLGDECGELRSLDQRWPDDVRFAAVKIKK